MLSALPRYTQRGKGKAANTIFSTSSPLAQVSDGHELDPPGTVLLSDPLDSLSNSGSSVV